jgi:hypothetical protein
VTRPAAPRLSVLRIEDRAAAAIVGREPGRLRDFGSAVNTRQVIRTARNKTCGAAYNAGLGL